MPKVYLVFMLMNLIFWEISRSYVIQASYSIQTYEKNSTQMVGFLFLKMCMN